MCSNSNIIKEAEAHCCISLCMVPRWSHNCSSCFQLPLCYLISNLQNGIVHRTVGTYLHMSKVLFQSNITKFQDCVTVKSLSRCEKQCKTDQKTQGWITTSMTDPAAKRADLEEPLLKKIES